MEQFGYEIEKEELKERKISVRMTDTELQRLAEKCGKNGLTIQNLFEVFVGDLTGGTYYSGSDEGDLASKWFDRHCFDLGEKSLLQHLLNFGSAPIVGTFIEALEEKKYFEEHPEELSKIYSDDEEPWFEEEIKDDTDGWNGTITEGEIASIKKWAEEYAGLKGEE